jgi:hypothetical protein
MPSAPPDARSAAYGVRPPSGVSLAARTSRAPLSHRPPFLAASPLVVSIWDGQRDATLREAALGWDSDLRIVLSQAARRRRGDGSETRSRQGCPKE